MQASPISCVVEPFSTANTTLKTTSDPVALATRFHGTLIQELAKRGVAMKESHPILGQAAYAIEGSFVQIDDGDRALRYFLSFLAGAAALEVKGWLFHGDVPIAELHARTTQTIGVFGGDSKQMLTTCATTAAMQIAIQVDEALANRLEVTP